MLVVLICRKLQPKNEPKWVDRWQCLQMGPESPKSSATKIQVDHCQVVIVSVCLNSSMVVLSLFAGFGQPGLPTAERPLKTRGRSHFRCSFSAKARDRARCSDSSSG
jgi:hypothetical protein